MAAATSDSDDDLISTINITPLVDIFLVLLIIFMVTANLFLEQERKLREIALTLPAAASGVPPDADTAPLNVIVDRTGKTYLDGAPTELAGIGAAIEKRKAAGKAPQAVLSADRELAYGKVTQVIDYLKMQGVGNLAINVEALDITEDGAVSPGSAPAAR